MQKMAEFEVGLCARQEGITLGLLNGSPQSQGTGAALRLVPYTKEACPSFSP